MMQEEQAKGASDTSGGDERQHHVPDQVSGYATDSVLAAGLRLGIMRWMLRQMLSSPPAFIKLLICLYFASQ